MERDSFEKMVMTMLLGGDHPDLAAVREQYSVAVINKREQLGNMIRVFYTIPDSVLVASIKKFGFADVVFAFNDDPLHGWAMVSIKDGRLDCLQCFYPKPWPEDLQVVRIDYAGKNRGSRDMGYVQHQFAKARDPLIGPHLIATGLYGSYHWLTCGHEMIEFMELCPEIVIGKFVAVTSMDSGALRLDEKEINSGWISRGEIGYSPRIRFIGELPHLKYAGCGFHEWYVFEKPRDIGRRSDAHPIVVWPQDGAVVPFVNLGFRVHDPYFADFAEWFWSQLEGIRPESYIADGDSCLTFITRENQIFEEVRFKVQ